MITGPNIDEGEKEYIDSELHKNTTTKKSDAEEIERSIHEIDKDVIQPGDPVFVHDVDHGYLPATVLQRRSAGGVASDAFCVGPSRPLLQRPKNIGDHQRLRATMGHEQALSGL